MEVESVDVTKWLKENKHIVTLIAILGISLLAFVIRARPVPNMEHKYLLALDPYPFYRYASYLVNNGILPKIDTMRYYPIYYIVREELLAHTYFNTLLYYILHPITGISLMDVFIVYPAIVTFLGMLAMYFAVKKLFNNRYMGLIAAFVLAVIPGFQFRSMSGYADKEPLGILLFPMIVYFIARGLKEQDVKKSAINGILAGVSSALLMSNWGGHAFIHMAIAAMMLIIVMFKDIKLKDVAMYSGWMLSIPLAVIINLRYGGWAFYGNTTFATMIIAYLSVIASYIIRNKKIKIPKGIVSVLIGVVVFVGIISLFDHAYVPNMIKQFYIQATNPIATTRLGSSVAENQPTSIAAWLGGYGAVLLILFIIGAGLLLYDGIKGMKKDVVTSILFMFTISTMIMSNLPDTNPMKYIGDAYLYFVLLFGVWLIYFYFINKDHKDISEEHILAAMWVFLTVIAARASVRILWATYFPTAIAIAYLTVKSYFIIGDKLRAKQINDKYYPYAIIAVVLIVLLVFANKSYASAIGYYPLQEKQWDVATQWVEQNTNKEDVFTHWWDYGYWVQSIWNRTTIFDGGNYHGSWNQINARFIMTGTNETQWMNALHWFHEPKYFVIVSDDVMKFYQMARIGERDIWNDGKNYQSAYYGIYYDPRGYPVKTNAISGYDKVYELNQGSIGVMSNDVTVNGMLWPAKDTLVASILLPVNSTGNETQIGPGYGVVYNKKTRMTTILPFNCVCVENKGCFNITTGGIDGCYMVLPKVDFGPYGTSPLGAIYIPGIVRDSLFTRLYLVNETIPHFKLVYDNGAPMCVTTILDKRIMGMRIWEIDYSNYSYAIDECPVEEYGVDTCGNYTYLKSILG